MHLIHHHHQHHQHHQPLFGIIINHYLASLQIDQMAQQRKRRDSLTCEQSGSPKRPCTSATDASDSLSLSNAIQTIIRVQLCDDYNTTTTMSLPPQSDSVTTTSNSTALDSTASSEVEQQFADICQSISRGRLSLLLLGPRGSGKSVVCQTAQHGSTALTVSHASIDTVLSRHWQGHCLIYELKACTIPRAIWWSRS
jgi:hypothetical protein